MVEHVLHVELDGERPEVANEAVLGAQVELREGGKPRRAERSRVGDETAAVRVEGRALDGRGGIARDEPVTGRDFPGGRRPVAGDGDQVVRLIEVEGAP